MPISLATQNALDISASFVSAKDEKVLIVAPTHHLAVGLLDRLQLTTGIPSILVTPEESSPSAVFNIDEDPGFSLVWIQPVDKNQDIVFNYLDHPKLDQVIVLQASWLGRKLLPEWKAHTGHYPALNSTTWKRFRADQNWSYREIGFGNLSSLVWGFLAGRLIAMGWPDLADHCNARMRRDLFPKRTGLAPTYLRIIHAVRKN